MYDTDNKRAVIYCRVSTDEESQRNALEGQVKEAIQAVNNKGWVLVDQYIDEGKSGTTVKHRPQYNRLVKDIDRDLFDIIVIKSQDRLMRNTLEWYIFIDKINKKSKKLYFYLENKFYDAEDSLVVGIKAILAEEYSRELSKKINNATQNRQKTCSAILLNNKTWGYKKVNKQVVIDENEAEIVRLIYDMCIEGYGARTISKTLTEKGVKSRSGGDFSYVTIRKIVRNPLYKGDVVMNRRHLNFESKKTEYVPKEEWIIHEHAVPPIVTAEVWAEANSSLDSRYSETFAKRGKPIRIGKKRGNYVLSGKIFCGECGKPYWRRYRRTASDDITVYWSCSEYVTQGRTNNKTAHGKNMIKKEFSLGRGCDSPHMKEETLFDGLKNVSELLFAESGNRSESLIDESIRIFEETVLNSGSAKINALDKRLSEKEKQQEKLLDAYLNGDVSNTLYKKKSNSLETDIREIKKQIQQISRESTDAEQKKEYIENIKTEIRDIGMNEEIVYKIVNLIERILIFKTYIVLDFGEFGSIRMNIIQKTYKNRYLEIADEKMIAENNIQTP